MVASRDNSESRKGQAIGQPRVFLSESDTRLLPSPAGEKSRRPAIGELKQIRFFVWVAWKWVVGCLRHRQVGQPGGSSTVMRSQGRDKAPT